METPTATDAALQRRVHALWLAAMWCALLGAAFSADATESIGSDALHSGFDDLLSAHVTDGHVDYDGIADSQAFSDYLTTLGTTDLEALSGEKEVLAYWINAYNAFAIKGIIDGHSPSSFFGRIGYFKNQKYLAAKEYIDLYTPEREVLIPLGEPRIHFAIVCASASCPKLESEVYTAADLERQLEENTWNFVNDNSRSRFDVEKKTAHISKIFDWFEQDFVDDAGSVQRYLARYVDDPKLADALENDEYRIKYLPYDWSLNGTLTES